MTQIFIAVQEQEAKRRRIAALSGELEALYLRLQMLQEDVQVHHQRIRGIKDNAKALSDWAAVSQQCRPHLDAIAKMERSYEFQSRMAIDLRLELTELGAVPREAPPGLAHPNRFRPARK